MKTNNLIILLFTVLFGLFGFIFWWIKVKSPQYISDTASKTISDAKNNFSAKDIVTAGASVGLDKLFNALSSRNKK